MRSLGGRLGLLRCLAARSFAPSRSSRSGCVRLERVLLRAPLAASLPSARHACPLITPCGRLLVVGPCPWVAFLCCLRRGPFLASMSCLSLVGLAHPRFASSCRVCSASVRGLRVTPCLRVWRAWAHVRPACAAILLPCVWLWRALVSACWPTLFRLLLLSMTRFTGYLSASASPSWRSARARSFSPAAAGAYAATLSWLLGSSALPNA